MTDQRAPRRLPFDSRHREDENTPVTPYQRPPRRSMDERMQSAEERLDGLEDWIGNTKVTQREEAAETKRIREKRIDRAWTVGLALILAAILYAASWLHIAPPAPSHEPKVEVKP